MKINHFLCSYRNQVILSAIILFGLFFRLQGLEWGLPNALHPTYSYHPDEIYLLKWADLLKEGRIISKHFIYGGTFYYLTLQFINWLGAIFTEHNGGLILSNTILLGRIFGVVYALAAIYLLYEAGRILFSDSVGLLAAFILAVLPGHIFWAQRVRPDELFTLMFVVNLFFMARIIKKRGGLNLNLILGGGLLGIATATRFPAAVLMIGYLVAIFFRLSSDFCGDRRAVKRKLFQSFGVTSGAAVLGYFFASPHTFFYFTDFVSGLRNQWQYQSGAFNDGFGQGPGWFQYAGRILRQAMGEPFQGLLLVALLFAVWKRTREHILLIALVVPYFLLLAKTSWIVTRYAVPLLPFFSLLIACFLVEMAGRSKMAKALVVLIVIGSASWSLAASLAYANTLRNTDPRDAAANWMVENLAGGSTIGAFVGYGGDLFNNPPRTPRHRWGYFVMKRDNIDNFFKLPFDYIIINELPLQRNRLLKDDQISTSYRYLRDWGQSHPGYSIIKEFRNEVSFAGFDFGYLFNSIDYTLSLPRVLIYKRTGSASAVKADDLSRH